MKNGPLSFLLVRMMAFNTRGSMNCGSTDHATISDFSTAIWAIITSYQFFIISCFTHNVGRLSIWSSHEDCVGRRKGFNWCLEISYNDSKREKKPFCFSFILEMGKRNSLVRLCSDSSDSWLCHLVFAWLPGDLEWRGLASLSLSSLGTLLFLGPALPLHRSSYAHSPEHMC